MNSRFGLPVALAAALTLGVAAPLAAAETIVKQVDANSVLVVDYSGRPPFKRRVVEIDALSATELARFEERIGPVEVDASRIGERISIADYRGKPPFRRRSVEIDASNAVEFARFEESDEGDTRPFRPRFPGKQFPVRR